MFGNIVTGCSVLAPAGMLIELSSDLGVTVRDAGLLITFGAVMLCVGSPLTAWLTSRIERRTLLTATLAVMAVEQRGFGVRARLCEPCLIIRLIMLAVGALYTPQAAGTAALIVSPEKRGSTIAYIFLGWSLAAAVGLPLITFVASRYGWRAVYGGIGVIGCAQLPSAGVAAAGRIGRRAGGSQDLDRRRAQPDDRFAAVDHDVQMSGQFVVFTFMGPLLTKLTHAGPDAVGLVFAIYGMCGFIGIVIATRIVDSWGALQDLGAVHDPGADGHHRMGAQRRHLSVDGRLGRDLGIGVSPRPTRCSRYGWSQRRRRSRRPRCRSTPPCSISARPIGSAIGGVLYARDLLYGAGYVAMGFVALALMR